MRRRHWAKVAGSTMRIALIAGAATLMGIGTIYARGGHTARVKKQLTATSNAPEARGKARLKIRSSRKGKFTIVAAKLEGEKTYDVVIGGIKVGELQTNRGGHGRASFSTQPRTKDRLLGFDPRGEQISVRDQESGDDILVGDLPDDDPNAIACCLPDDDGEGGTECEDVSEAECAAAGGTPVGVPGGTVGASCLPNPCSDAPEEGEGIVCCTNATHDDESESECEDVATDSACANIGGVVVQAASCDPNPCEGAAPTDSAACCVPEDGEENEIECEVISAEACSARNGTPAGTSSCSSDPCGSGSSGSDDGTDEASGG